MMANNLTKALSIIKHEYFVEMIKIKDKRKILAFIKQKNNFRDTFQQHKIDISKLFRFGIAVFKYVYNC